MTLSCGHEPTPGEGVGFGQDAEGKTYCYACCAERDRLDMTLCGRATLYLCSVGPHVYRVSNWPGSLTFPVSTHKTGRHNIAGRRCDVWFLGPDDALWHGVTYGDNTQICHCRRLKSR